jgi:hypothetical protein
MHVPAVDHKHGSISVIEVHPPQFFADVGFAQTEQRLTIGGVRFLERFEPFSGCEYAARVVRSDHEQRA